MIFFVRLQPGKVWLVITVHTSHQFNVWSVFIRQVAVPSLSEITVTPGPLFLTGIYMMIGHMKKTRFDMFFIASHKIKFRIDSHVRSRHRNVL